MSRRPLQPSPVPGGLLASRPRGSRLLVQGCVNPWVCLLREQFPAGPPLCRAPGSRANADPVPKILRTDARPTVRASEGQQGPGWQAPQEGAGEGGPRKCCCWHSLKTGRCSKCWTVREGARRGAVGGRAACGQAAQVLRGRAWPSLPRGLWKLSPPRRASESSSAKWGQRRFPSPRVVLRTQGINTWVEQSLAWGRLGGHSPLQDPYKHAASSRPDYSLLPLPISSRDVGAWGLGPSHPHPRGPPGVAGEEWQSAGMPGCRAERQVPPASPPGTQTSTRPPPAPQRQEVSASFPPADAFCPLVVTSVRPLLPSLSPRLDHA